MSLEGIKAWGGDVITESMNGLSSLGHHLYNAGAWVVGEVVDLGTWGVGVGQAIAADPAGSALAVKTGAIALATNPFAFVAAHTPNSYTNTGSFIFAFWAWLFVGLFLGDLIGKIARKVCGQAFFTRGFGALLRWVIVLAGVGYSGYALWLILDAAMHAEVLATTAMVAGAFVGPFVLLFGTISLGIRLNDEPRVVDLNAPAEVPAEVQAVVPAKPAETAADTTEQK